MNVSKLETSSNSSLGFLGLNTQESEVTLPEGYATEALNCVLDKYGRLGSRKGYNLLTTNSGTLSSGAYIKSIFEFKTTTGITSFISSGDGKLFTGTTTLTEKKVRNAANTADVPLVVFDDNWQIASLPYGSGSTAVSEGFLAQKGQPLVIYRLTGGNYTFHRVGDVGSVPTGLTTNSFDPSCVLSSFGRIWCADLTLDTHTVYYSRLLQGHDFSASGSGLIDISSVVGNNDKIVGLASHNGFLVIFCQNNIVLYSNAQTPTSITLSDVINGVGCIARDSIQNTGTDLIFLSSSGVRSLARTIQEKSTPMRELSINVRDQLSNEIQNEVLSNIKSVYFERDAFYLLSLPSTNVIYCFDTRVILDNGGSRVTHWVSPNIKSFYATSDRNLLLGVKNGIANYFGYLDGVNTYSMTYYSPNSDFGVPSTLKLLKKAKLTIICNEVQNFVLKYAFDYTTNYVPRTFENSNAVTSSEYNTSEYGLGEYSGGLNILTVSLNIGGSGKVVKFGIETTINSSPVSIQKADLNFKLGKQS